MTWRHSFGIIHWYDGPLTGIMAHLLGTKTHFWQENACYEDTSLVWGHTWQLGPTYLDWGHALFEDTHWV